MTTGIKFSTGYENSDGAFSHFPLSLSKLVFAGHLEIIQNPVGPTI
jgi:hypothetical protein